MRRSEDDQPSQRPAHPRRRNATSRRSWPWLAAAAALTCVLYVPLCHVLHRCGCRPLWSGADAHCNVRASEGPHCPWCQHWALGAGALAVTLWGQTAAFRAVDRRVRTPALAGAAAAAAMLPALSIGATLTWLPTDYPHLFVRDARARLGLPAGPIPCVVPSPRERGR
jgi:hypothetical protein